MEDWEDYNSYNSRPCTDSGRGFAVVFMIMMAAVLVGPAMIWAYHHF